MKAKRYTDERICRGRPRAGAKTKDLYRKYGISEPTFYDSRPHVRRRFEKG
jgi:hypothetical protein